MDNNVNRELGILETKINSLEKEVAELYTKVDSFDKKFNSLEISIKDLTRVVEDQKKTISEVADIIKSLQLLKKIGYAALWVGGLIAAYKSGLKEMFEYFKK